MPLPKSKCVPGLSASFAVRDYMANIQLKRNERARKRMKLLSIDSTKEAERIVKELRL